MSLLRGFSRRTSGSLGMLSSTFLLGGIVTAISMSPWFDWTRDYVSNLGEAFRPSSPWFNYGLILGGVFTMMFSLGLFRNSEGTYERSGALLLLAAGFFLALVGVFPLPHPLHSAVAGGAFFILPFSLFRIGWGRVQRLKTLSGRWTLVTGGIIFAFDVSMIPLYLTKTVSIAIPEFFVALTASVWVFLFGLGLFTRRIN